MKKVLPAAITPLFVFAFSLFVGVVNVHASQNRAGAGELKAVSGPGEGQVTVTFKQIDPTGKGFAVLYGMAPSNYLYSLRDLTPPGYGGTKTVTIGGLTPGKNYYFIVQPTGGGDYEGFSNEAWAPGLAVAKDKSTWVSTPGGAANVVAVTGSVPGTIDVSWTQDVATVGAYAVVYGVKSGVYGNSLRELSSQGKGAVKTVRIGGLKPGETYYFAVEPSGFDNSYLSGEASAKAAK